MCILQDYEAFCIDVYFCLELNAAEWAEQCQGLGCDMSQGIDFDAFESLFLEYGAWPTAPDQPASQPMTRRVAVIRSRHRGRFHVDFPDGE